MTKVLPYAIVPVNDSKFYLENRYKHEAMINNEAVLFEILDSCPKVVYRFFIFLLKKYFLMGISNFLFFIQIFVGWLIC